MSKSHEIITPVFFGVTIISAILKLFGVIQWSWWLIVSPVLLLIAFGIVIFFIVSLNSKNV